MSLQSQFSLGEIGQILIAWLVLSFAISYTAILDFLNGSGTFDYIVAGFIATTTRSILHEMGHKFVAVTRGYVAHFRLWTWGLVLTLTTVVVTGGTFLFGAPGAVYIGPPAAMMGYAGQGYGYPYTPKDVGHENMIISAAGPGLNLFFALVFLGMLFVVPAGFLSTVASSGFLLNVGLGSFNMLPIPPLDGSKIFRKNISIALAIALPLWGMFALLYLGF